MLKVLVNAYAVCPGRGSEEGMGWNWCSNLARYCDLHIITESEFREEIRAALSNYKIQITDYKQLPKEAPERWADRMHFYFVDAGETEERSARIRKMCWNQGTWRFYWFYQQWQKKAVVKAREIIAQQEFMGEPIQVMHQLNMVGFREPGMLYLINQDRETKKLPRIPLVWGPSAGYGSIPHSFRWRAGLKEYVKFCVKSFLNNMQLRYHHRVKEMALGSDALIAATPTMRSGLAFFYHRKVSLNSEVGCYIDSQRLYESNKQSLYENENLVGSEDNKQENKESKENLVGSEDNKQENKESKENPVGPEFRAPFSREGKLKLLWVGRFIYTKQLEMALQVMRCNKDMAGLELHIVGEGFTPKITEKMHRKAKDYGIDHLCHWHGKISNTEVQQLMRECDLLFFTSIFEATSTVILEAVSNRLPILCFDTCGFGVVVDETIGYKIPLTNLEQSVVDFSTALNRINRHREWLPRWSEGCIEKQKRFDWTEKTLRVVKMYEKLVATGGSKDRRPVYTRLPERIFDYMADIFINWYVAR